MKRISKTDTVAAISKYEDISITEAKEALNKLIQNVIIFRERNNPSEAAILDQLKYKYSVKKERLTEEAAGLKEEITNLARLRDAKLAKIEEIEKRFKI